MARLLVTCSLSIVLLTNAEQSATPITKADMNLFQIKPTEGAQAGGTIITLSGGLLRRFLDEDDVRVKIGPARCPLTKISNITMSIECRSRPALQGTVGKALEVVITTTKQTYHPQATFTYVKEKSVQVPVIESVQPLASVKAGGVRITVTGQGLGHVNTMRMRVHIMCSSKHIWTLTPEPAQICNVDHANSSWMCYTPPLTNPYQIWQCQRKSHPREPLMCFGSGTRVGLEEATDLGKKFGLQFLMAFMMDGSGNYFVWDDPVTYFDNPVICYQKNPIAFRPFWPYNDKQLTIQGYQLHIGDITQTAYTVTVGDAACGNVKVANNTICCTPPPHQIEHHNATLQITVEVGRHRVVVGLVEYPAPTTAAIVGGMVIGAVSFTLVIGAIIKFFCWNFDKSLITTKEMSTEEEEYIEYWQTTV